ncbi:MAG: hypothetical protein JO081_14035 [Alphaproteobacteria bacterium]|nr:hypothetical protein [Alphaproteobacteria bacterium]
MTETQFLARVLGAAAAAFRVAATADERLIGFQKPRNGRAGPSLSPWRSLCAIVHAVW